MLFALIASGCGKTHSSTRNSTSNVPSGSSPSGISIFDSSSDPEVRRQGEQGRVYRRSLQAQLDSTFELQQVASAQAATLSQCAGERSVPNFEEFSRTTSELSTLSTDLESDLQNAILRYDNLERQTRLESTFTSGSGQFDLSARREQILILEISNGEQRLRDLNRQLNSASNTSTASIDAPASAAIASQSNQLTISNQIYTLSSQVTERKNQLATMRTNRQNRDRRVEQILNNYKDESRSFEAVLAAFEQRSTSLRTRVLALQQTVSGACPQTQ